MAGDTTTARGDKLRKRKTKADTNVVVEPLDEDEQTEMINKLRADSIQQAESMLQIFLYMCIVAAVVLMLSVLYLDQWHMAAATSSSRKDDENVGLIRPLSVAHGLASAVLHCLSPSLTRPRQVSPVVRVAMVVDGVVAVCTLWAARRDAPEDGTLLWMHYGIVASNVFVVLAAILLRWDGESTDKAFEDLRQAQYRYKSL